MERLEELQRNLVSEFEDKLERELTIEEREFLHWLAKEQAEEER
ncbi:hypothetical protein [Halobacillus litoralis]|nr:hypothetical protein [Halobacillus litoralis]